MSWPLPPGTVEEYFTNCGGNTVRIQHASQNQSTLYAHLSQFIAPIGANVARSAVIALSGNSVALGCASVGAHLHFGVMDGFSTTTSKRIDPYGWSPVPGAPVTFDPWSYDQGYLWTTNPPSLNIPPIASPPIQNFTPVSGTLSQNATWTMNGSPYVIEGSFTVAPGVTLTIQPGVVVKFMPQSGINGVLNVNGTLIAQGTPTNKIYFTSIKDDSVGGDTNGDGGATFPASGNYDGIIFSTGSVGNINNAVLRYGAWYGGSSSFAANGLIVNNGGVVSLSNSSISQTFKSAIAQISGTLIVSFSDVSGGSFQSGINIYNGNANINNNYLYNIPSIGVSVSGVSSVAITNNNIFSMPVGFGLSGPSASLTLTNNSFSYNSSAAGSISISAINNFISSGNTASGGINAYRIYGEVNSDATLTPRDLPYSIFNYLTINPGKTLTIAPGTIIKFHYNNPTAPYTDKYIRVQGTLNVNGTPSNKVYFTSINDDTIGFNPSSYNYASPGDYVGIIFDPGSTGNINNLVLRYGGLQGSGIFNWPVPAPPGGIKNLGGTITITNSRFNNNLHSGIYHTSGSTYVSQSSFYSNTSYGIFNNATNTAVQASSNWWGSLSGPYHPTLNPNGNGNQVSNNVSFIPYLAADPTLPPPIDLCDPLTGC